MSCLTSDEGADYTLADTARDAWPGPPYTHKDDIVPGHEADTPVSVLMFIPADEMAPNSGVHPDLQSHPQAITDNISRF